MRNPDRQTIFRFKQFEISNCRSAMKVGTDGVLLGAWAGKDIDAGCSISVLDVGCGTGVVMLMMAQRLQNATVTGIEIDKIAAEEATENCANSPWSSRCRVYNDDFIEYAATDTLHLFDIIVSNPPFFTDGALAPDEIRRMARHEGSLTFEKLLRGATRLLRPTGRLCMILPSEHRSRIEFQAELNGFDILQLCNVRTTPRKPPKRILVEMQLRSKDKGFTPIATKEHELMLTDAEGNASAEYSALVNAFYIRM